MDLRQISPGRNPPTDLHAVIEIPVGGVPVKYEIDKASGALFVDRSDPGGGVEDANKALEAAQAGRMLVFLPEGTFTRAPGLLPFRLGAFVIAARQNLRVLPVTLTGTRSILRSDQWFPRRGVVSLRVGSLVSADGPDFPAAIRLRDRVRAEILANCGEPDATAP